MKKLINKFLRDKNEFHKDAGLKALNETYYYILTEERRLLGLVVWKNLKYFLKYKKLYLTKLWSLTIGILFAVVITVCMILFFLDYFGWINFHISRAVKKPESQLVVYLPDSDTIAQIECIKRRITYIIFFPVDPQKNWITYKKRFQQLEAHGMSNASSYYAKNGEYWGRYQMGKKAREIGNIKDITFEKFTSNPDLQEGCFLAWIRYLKDQMQPEINRYTGTHINGIQVTESGIIALAHNIGVGDCRMFLRNNGSTIPATSTRMAFLRIGGYNINNIE